jgi:hypothetical protein
VGLQFNKIDSYTLSILNEGITINALKEMGTLSKFD